MTPFLRVLAMALLLTSFLGSNARGATLRHAENFVLPAAQTLHDDLYVAGKVMDVQGTVDGDLIIAGQSILISGTVTGDLIAMGRDVTVTGHVGGTVRAAGSNITIGGAVAHDVVAGCGNLVIGPESEVGRDVLAGAGTSSFGGRIGRDVRVGSGTATFSGTVSGTVYAHAKDVVLSDGAVLEQDLLVTSRNEITKASGARVGGKVERRVPQEHERRHAFGGPIVGWIQGLIGFLIFGGLLHLLAPGAGSRAAETLRRSPLPSLGIGVLLAFGIPCAGVFLFLVGIFIGGWWIGLGAIALYFLALALGYVIASRYVGSLILGRVGSAPAAGWILLVGLVVLGLVTALPFLGWTLGWAAACFGLGAAAVAWYRARPAGEKPVLAPVAT